MEYPGTAINAAGKYEANCKIRIVLRRKNNKRTFHVPME